MPDINNTLSSMLDDEDYLEKAKKNLDSIFPEQKKQVIALKRIEKKEEEKNLNDKIAKQKQFFSETQSDLSKFFDNQLKKMTQGYKGILDEYTNNIQKLTYGLMGSGVSYKTLVDNMQVLTTNAYVKQNEVYKSLSNLISKGITTNASQRAFLEATSKQVGLSFDTTNESLNRLINLQKQDFSEARVAQMAGLKTFLQQNYQTSQYIHEGFQNVSAALVEAQSMMTSTTAAAVEGTVQKWLGALSSGGASSGTVSNIATAIGQLGSGDVSSLSGGMGNLIAMGASRAGLSYGNLLTGGLTQDETNALMGGIVSYIANMNTGSNVATNAIAKVFGLSVSDIKAAQNANAASLMTNNPNYSISEFFNQVQQSTDFSSALNNISSNFLSGGALMQSTMGGSAAYDLVNLGVDLFKNTKLGKTAQLGLLGASMLGGPVTSTLAKLGNWALDNSGTAQALLFSSLATGGDIFSSIGNAFGSILSGGSLKDAGMGLLDALGIGSGALMSDYNALGSRWDARMDQVKQTGTTSGSRTSGTSNSYSATTGGGGKLNSSVNANGDIFEGTYVERTITDVYDQLLLTNDYLSNPLVTMTHIAEAGNAVVLGSAENTKYITDMLTITAVSTQNIYALLENYFAGGQNKITDMSSLNLTWWGSWAGQPAK